MRRVGERGVSGIGRVSGILTLEEDGTYHEFFFYGEPHLVHYSGRSFVDGRLLPPCQARVVHRQDLSGAIRREVDSWLMSLTL